MAAPFKSSSETTAHVLPPVALLHYGQHVIQLNPLKGDSCEKPVRNVDKPLCKLDNEVPSLLLKTRFNATSFYRPGDVISQLPFASIHRDEVLVVAAELVCYRREMALKNEPVITFSDLIPPRPVRGSSAQCS